MLFIVVASVLLPVLRVPVAFFAQSKYGPRGPLIVAGGAFFVAGVVLARKYWRGMAAVKVRGTVD